MDKHTLSQQPSTTYYIRRTHPGKNVKKSATKNAAKNGNPGTQQQDNESFKDGRMTKTHNKLTHHHDNSLFLGLRLSTLQVVVGGRYSTS